MDPAPLRFVYHQFFLCCMSQLADIASLSLQSDAWLQMNFIWKRVFFSRFISNLVIPLWRGKYLGIELDWNSAGTFRAVLSFSWKAVLCNYPNHSFKSSGAVKYSHAGSYTYWLEASYSDKRNNVSGMSLAEQSAHYCSTVTPVANCSETGCNYVLKEKM